MRRTKLHLKIQHDIKLIVQRWRKDAWNGNDQVRHSSCPENNPMRCPSPIKSVMCTLKVITSENVWTHMTWHVWSHIFASDITFEPTQDAWNGDDQVSHSVHPEICQICVHPEVHRFCGLVHITIRVIFMVNKVVPKATRLKFIIHCSEKRVLDKLTHTAVHWNNLCKQSPSQAFSEVLSKPESPVQIRTQI